MRTFTSVCRFANLLAILGEGLLIPVLPAYFIIKYVVKIMFTETSYSE